MIDFFSRPGWKFDTTHATKHGDFTNTFQMEQWQIYQSHEMFTRVQKFHGIQKLRLKR